MMAIGVLAFIVVLLTSVMLHEAGHFLTAKLFGMKATQFFVGFGPTLFSRQRGETEYGVKAIPAGGFVKIIGMTPLEDVAPEDAPRAFINKPGWQRFIVLVAGSTMHFVIALVLLFVLLISWPTVLRGPAAVASVDDCLVASTSTCSPGAPVAPAKGVLQKGDVVVAVNGKTVAHGGEELGALTRKAAPGPLTYTVQRGGKTLDLTMTPVKVDGNYRVGISIEDAPSAHRQRVGFGGAVTGTFSSSGVVPGFAQMVTGSFKALGTVPRELGHLVTHPSAKRSANAGASGAQVTSVFGVANYAGEAFKAGGFSGGLANLLFLAASVNVFVGIFNLFPLLPLDGGHVAILFYQKVRDGVRRRRKLPVAGPVDMAKLMPVTYAALALIVGASMILLYADIFNPVANPY